MEKYSEKKLSIKIDELNRIHQILEDKLVVLETKYKESIDEFNEALLDFANNIRYAKIDNELFIFTKVKNFRKGNLFTIVQS